MVIISWQLQFSLRYNQLRQLRDIVTADVRVRCFLRSFVLMMYHIIASVFVLSLICDRPHHFVHLQKVSYVYKPRH